MKWFYIILYCTAYVLPMHGERSAGVDFAHQQVGTIRIICIRPCCRRSLRNAITRRPLSYVCIGSTKPFYNPGRSLPGYVCGWFELRTRSANTIIMRDPVPEGLFFFFNLQLCTYDCNAAYLYAFCRRETAAAAQVICP